MAPKAQHAGAERTPAGGDASRIIWLGPDGQETTQENATGAEIVESVGGVDINRTYMTRTGGPSLPQWQPPGGVLAEPQFFDHKTAWDVTINDGGQFRLVETLAELKTALGWDGMSPAELKKELAEWRLLQSWVSAPAGLRAEVNELLG